MGLSTEQIANLLAMISNVEPDELDCDSCLTQVAEFAELHLASRDIPEAMRAVQVHLEQCACCQDELNALLKGLSAIHSPE
jgi:antitoxin component HigA of HigAB toxin-antitoxin module